MSDTDDYVATITESELQEGKMKLVSTEGTPLLFIKQQGKIHVIDNRCPHMGCGFSGGTLENAVIVCPCHDWRFNLETGEYEEEPSYKIKKYEWKVEAGKIWVKLEF